MGREISVPTIRFFRARDGKRIAWSLDGPDDAPLLVCPAWWVSHVEKDWEDPRFRTFFAKLAREFRVVRYDRAGVGLSDRLETHPQAGLDGELALLEQVVDEADAVRASLLGISCGGPVAVAYAAKHPERIERLVLYGSYVDGADVSDPEVRKAMIALVRAHWGLGSRALADVFFPEIERDRLDRYTARQRESSDAETAACLLDLTYRLDVRSIARRVRAPTAVVHRRRDRAIPLAAGRELAASIPGATFVSLDGKSHPPWEGASDVPDTILGFLRGEPGAAAGAASGCRLDERTRELVVDGERRKLTPLEFGVLAHLTARRDEVVTRDELLEHVWAQPYRGSNVVDAVVRSLRKKLAPYAASVATATGHGYRFVGFRPDP